MRLATQRDGTRDGRLLVVASRRDVAVPADGIARTLQAALDEWDQLEPQLRALAGRVDRGELEGTPVDPEALAAPLPRAYEWVDGSAFLNHVWLVRKARGAEPPSDWKENPLVYQGGSGVL